MAKKKKKIPQLPKLSASGLAEQAVAQLENGQPAAALALLVKAQNDVHRQRSLGQGAPADSSETLARINQLLARTHFVRGLAEKSLSKKTASLQEAVKHAPEADYLVALGACHLLQGDTQAAQAPFQQAQTLSPDSLRAGGAAFLGALATGQSREAKDLLKLWTPPPDDPRLVRLSVLRHLLARNFAPARTRWESIPTDSLLSAGPLLGGLLALAGGDNEAASRQLDTPPPLFGKLTRAEAAVTATQMFYNGVAHFQAGRFLEAALGFQEADTLLATHEIPELPWRDRLAAYYHRIAANVLREGDVPAALACWQQAIKLNAHDKVGKANLLAARETQAAREWQNGNVPAALELWQEVLKTKQQDENLLRNVALAWEKLERPAEAIPFWRQVARLLRAAVRGKTATESEKQRLARLEKHLLQLLVDARRPGPEIIKELEDALRADVHNRELRREYAGFLLDVGRLPQALKQYEAIERAEGESVEILVQKGMVLDLMGKQATARRCLERALVLEPDNKLARGGLVFMLSHEVNQAVAAQDSERVIELCQQQLELVPESMPPLQTLAALYLMNGRAPEADEIIARILALHPQDPVIHTMVGRLYLIGQADKKAEKEFRLALEIAPGPDTLFQIGSKYLSVKQPKKALKYFKQAASTASCELLIEIGNDLADDYESEAGHYFDLAAAKDPAHPEPHLAKGVMLLNADKFEEAGQEFDHALRLANGRPEFAGLLDEVKEFKRDLKEIAKLQNLLASDDLPSLAGMPQDIRRLLAGLGKGPGGFF